MSARLLSTLSLPPATLSALAAAGYETVNELSAATPEQLSRDLNLPLPASQAVFSAARSAPATLPMTQSVAAMMGAMNNQRLYSTSCAPLDDLLGGGLKCGSVLEISGPAGCGKEHVAADAIKAFVARGQVVLFIDMQGMVPPAAIKRALVTEDSDADTLAGAQTRGLDLVQYLAIRTPVAFVIFLRNLSAYLESQPSTALVVFNSLVFPMQGLSPIERNTIMESLTQTLARACASKGLTVIITSHLVSQPVNPPGDGGSNSDVRGGKWIMKRVFGDRDFPKGRTYRVLIVPQGKDSGVLRLLLSPGHAPIPNRPVPEVRYQRVAGALQHERTLRLSQSQSRPYYTQTQPLQ